MNSIVAVSPKLHGTRRGGPCGRPATVAGAHKGRPYVTILRAPS
jgi:hypothetical protein